MIYAKQLLAAVLAVLLVLPGVAGAQSAGYSVQGSGGGTTQSQVLGSSIPNADTDATAYGKAIYAGTGSRGSYGYLDTISTRASGPFFRLDANNIVAVLSSDTDTNFDVYRSSNNGRTWGGVTTVNVAVTVGAGQGGVATPSAYYIAGGQSGSIWRTVDFISFTQIDLSVPSGGVSGWSSIVVTSSRMVVFGRDTAANRQVICTSSAAAGINPTAAGHFTCQAAPLGGAGNNAGRLFVKQQAAVAVPGHDGTIIAIDSPSVSAIANVYRSTDHGVSWTLVTSALVATAADTTIDNNPGNVVECNSTGTVCLAATGARVYKSTDQGATWTSVFTDATGNLYGIVKFAEEPDIFTVLRSGCNGLNQPMAVRTDDGGTSWAPVVMERCSVVTGRGYPSISSSNGTFVASLTSQTAFLAFAGALYGASTQLGLNQYGETVATLSSLGLPVLQLPTYSAGLTVDTATAAGTGAFASICGSASKVVRIKRFELNGSVATAATRSTVVLTKSSTAVSGGTATALTAAPLDSRNGAATATLVNFYTVLATAGTSVGVVGAKTRTFPITATIAATDYIPQLVFDYTGIDREPIVLRATTECVTAAFAATTTNAPTLHVRWEWTEHTE